MKKLHLGCSGYALHDLQTLGEILDDFRDAGYHSVDLWLYRYIRDPGDPMNQEDWRDWVQDVKQKIHARNLYVGQAHSLLDQYVPEDFAFRAPSEMICRQVEACAMLGCRRVIFHPLFYVTRVPDEATRQKVLDYNIRWFTLLRPVAERFDVLIQLENTFDYMHVQQPGDAVLPFTSPEDILTMLDALGSQFEACLDTGHANIEGRSPADFVRKWGSRLKTLHLNDNVGRFDSHVYAIYEDMHELPGFGTVDWAPFFEALYEVGYDGIFNLEPGFYLQKSLRKARQIQLKAGADITRAMAEKAGFVLE